MLAALLTTLLALEPTVTWDRSTVTLIARDAYYPRAVKLRDGTLVAGYSKRGAVYAKRSRDGGKTWVGEVRVGTFPEGNATNSELLELADGRVMYLFNERAGNDARGEPDNGVAVAFSRDGGATWTKPVRIYGGGPMWEPVALQKPDGEVLVFVADEKPYPRDNDQQITVLSSKDGGATWGAPTNAAYRAGFRDGMAVPQVLADGRLVAAIEDNGLVRGPFKPAIVDLSDASAWPVGGDSDKRWGALTEPLADEMYAGAPYLRVMPSGPTVLSAQVGPDDRRAKMTVWVGDAAARGFAGRSEPFAGVADDGAGQLWNGLLVKDADTVSALTGTRVKGVSGAWMIDGNLSPSPSGRGPG